MNTALLTLWCLCLDEGLNEWIGRLSVEWQSISQRLQLRTFVEECFLEATAAGVEILLDGVECHVKNSTLLRWHVSYRWTYPGDLLHVLWYVLFTYHISIISLWYKMCGRQVSHALYCNSISSYPKHCQLLWWKAFKMGYIRLSNHKMSRPKHWKKVKSLSHMISDTKILVFVYYLLYNLYMEYSKKVKKKKNNE